MSKIPASERALLFAIGDKLADNVTLPHVTGLLHREVMTEPSNDDRDVITELVEGSKPGDFEGVHASVALAVARVSGIIRNQFSSRAPKKRPDLVVSGPESGWLAEGVSKATAIDRLVLERHDDGGLIVPTNATAGLFGNRKRVVVAY